MKKIRHRIKIYLPVLAMVMWTLPGKGQGHFSLSWSGNGTDHMNIYISEARVGGISLQAGDEIGVFDGEVCVGNTILTDEPTSIIAIAVSKAEPGTAPPNGYTPGNPITVKIWDAGTKTEHPATIQFLNPQSGEPVDPKPFSPGQSVLIKITAKKNITIHLTAADKIYDGKKQAQVHYYTVPETSIAGDVRVTVSNGKFRNEKVGKNKTVTAAIVISGPDTIHFNFHINNSATANIEKRPLTIKANDQSKIYGSEFRFGNDAFCAQGLVAGDEVTSATLSSKGASQTARVNHYEIAVEEARGNGLNNYSITYRKGQLTVDKKKLTITANNQSKNKGSAFSFKGNEFVTEGLVNNDQVTSATLTSKGAGEEAEAGSYSIIISSAVGTGLGNYTITYAEGTLTVIAVNHPPVATNPVTDKVINASGVLKIPGNTIPGPIFVDPDGDIITIQAWAEETGTLPGWAEISGDTLVFSPSIADTGCVTMVIEASDPSGALAADTFRLCVDGYPVGNRNRTMPSLVQLYPNPAQGMATLDFSRTIRGSIKLTVINITGKRIMQKHFYGGKQIHFDLSGNASGIYFVKLDFNGQHVIKKLILDRN